MISFYQQNDNKLYGTLTELQATYENERNAVNTCEKISVEWNTLSLSSARSFSKNASTALLLFLVISAVCSWFRLRYENKSYMCGCNFKFLFPSSSKVSIVLKTSCFLSPTHLFAYSKISIVSLIPKRVLSSLKSKTGMVKVPSISKMTPSIWDLTFLPPQVVIFKLLIVLKAIAAAVNSLEKTLTKNMPCTYVRT